MKETRISISKSDLQDAAKNGSMSPLDVEPLWQALSQNQQNLPSDADTNNARFGIEQLAWYAGGVLVLLAMTWLTERAVEVFGAGGLFALSLVYTGAFAALGNRLVKQGINIPGGILYTLAVGMTPVVIGSLLTDLHLDDFLNTNAGLLLLGSVAGASALVALNRARVSIVTIPVYASLWTVLMTLAAMLSRTTFSSSFDLFPNSDLWSITFGLAILALSIGVDSRFGRARGRDYSWWGYFIGLAAFWIPLSFQNSGGELGKFIYFSINVLLMLSSVILARRVLLVAGAIGAVYYVSHILFTFFSNSLALPFVLVGAGIGLILLGNQYRRHHAAVDAAVLGLVPASWRNKLPGRV